MNDKQTQQLSTPEDYARGIVKLLQGARKTVDVFSPELTPLVFSDGELIEAARAFALRNQHTTMRVLIRDTAPLTRQGHRFKIIAQRISSKVLVRALATDFHSRDDAFVIADKLNYVLRRQASSWDGLHDSSRPETARQLTTAFNEMWEHSLPEPGVRRLHI